MIHLKKNSILFLFILLFTVSKGFAQQNSGKAFSLEEAKKFAVQNNYNAQIAVKDYEISRQQYKQYLSQGLPQINGSLGYNYNIEPIVSLLPGDFFGQPGTFQQVSFSPWYQVNGNITGSMVVLDGSYIMGVKAAKTYKELSQNQRTKAEIDVKEETARNYYTVLLLSETIAIMDSIVTNLEKVYFETEQFRINGFREYIDVEQIKLSVDQTKNQVAKMRTQKELAERMLKLGMGYPTDQEIILTDKLLNFNPEKPADYIFNADLNSFKTEDHIESKILQKLYDVNKMNQNVEFSKAFPSLRTFFSWNYNGFSNDRSRPVLFSSGSQYFKGGTTWGFSLNVPIFSSLYRHSTWQKAKIQTEKVALQQKQADEGLKMAFANAKANYVNTYKMLESERNNVELARKISTTNSIKFKEGLITSFEMTNSEYQYLNAVSSYVNTLYSLLNYKLDFDKLNNKL
jgi:outer membrane protein TolC